jgi:hypothetical protein
MKKGLVLAVLAMGLAIGASAEVITFQDGVSPTPDYAGTADAHIISWDGSQNQTGRNADGTSDPGTAGGGNPQNTGAHEWIEEGDFGGGNLDSKCIVIKFDVSSIPQAAVVGSAKVGLYYVYERNAGGGADGPGDVSKGWVHPHYLYAAKILKPWIEGDGGGAANGNVDGADTPDGVAVTWNHTGVELWEAIGAEGPSDTEMPESAIWFKPDPGMWIWFPVTNMCQDWVADPASNNGLKISQEPNNIAGDGTDGLGAMMPQGAHNFASRNNPDAAQRPKLVVEILAASGAGGDWTLYK